MTAGGLAGGLERRGARRGRLSTLVRSPWLRDVRVLVAGGLLVILIICGLFGSRIAPHGAESTNFDAILKSPSFAHPLGTDHVGRDVLSRGIVGARIALEVSLISLAVAGIIGVTAGLVSGYAGGWTDRVIMGFTDIVLSFPPLVLILAATAALGVSLTHAMIAIGIAASPTFARITRGSVLSVRSLEYVTAARTLGAMPARIILRHVLPNILAPLVVLASLQVGLSILAEAGLSYLGLGAQPPTASWGYSVFQERSKLATAPWTVFGPGAFILLTVLAANLFGDAIRDLTDPRQRNSR